MRCPMLLIESRSNGASTIAREQSESTAHHTSRRVLSPLVPDSTPVL